jgi:adenylate cyclase
MQVATTILCAAVGGDPKTLKALGRRAAEGALADCVELLCEISASTGGRLVKRLSDRIVACFATPDAAAGAAAKMLGAIAALPPFAAAKLGLRVAFHTGPVTGARDDATLKIVLRLVALAKGGQILTTQPTAALLGTSFRAFSRQLQASPLGRSGARAAIYEILSA